MRFALVLLLAVAFAGCTSSPSKEEEEAAKNTVVCQWNGERLVIRFDPGEARMLTATGERISLYQIPSGSGIRYSNGTLELRGKGLDLAMIDNGTATPLQGCGPYSIPTGLSK